MDTFLAYLLLFVASPLLGYFVFEKVKVSSFKVVVASLLILSVSYLLLKTFGLNTTGEEGDYTLIAFVFLFLNIFFFQLLKYRGNWIAIGLFVCFAAGSFFIVAWMALVTVMYVAQYYVRPILGAD